MSTRRVPMLAATLNVPGANGGGRGDLGSGRGVRSGYGREGDGQCDEHPSAQPPSSC